MFDTRWKKAMRDLIIHKTRTALVLIGLAIGLWGLGTTLVAYTILDHDLDENYRNTHPPHFTLHTENTTPEHRARIEALPNVLAVEKRAQVSGRIEMLEGVWLPLVLFAVSDFDAMKVARFSSHEGEWPPPRGTLLIERDGGFLAYLMHIQWKGFPPERSQSRERVRVQLKGRPPVESRISGEAFDPGLPPSRMEQMIYGYVSEDTLRDWCGDLSRDRLIATSVFEAKNEEGTATALEEMQGELERQGISVVHTIKHDPEHPHEFQMRSIMIILGSLGFLAFLLSAVLVVNLISTLLVHQTPQIGAMKALGASSRQVLATYLLSMGLLGLLNTVLTLPLVLRSGFGLADAIAGMLNFELLTETLPWWTPVSVILCGLFLPLVATNLAVRRVVRLPVREALDQRPASIESGDLKGLRRLPLPLSVAMAVRNTFRRKRRLLMTVMTMFTGTTIFISATNVRASLLETADVVLATMRHDLSIQLGNAEGSEELTRFLESHTAVQRVEAWRTERAILNGSKGGDPPESGTLIVVPDRTRAVNPKVLDGTWLDPSEPNGLVISQKLLYERPELRLGELYELSRGAHSHSVRLVGIIKQFGPSAMYLQESCFLSHFDETAPDKILVSLHERRHDHLRTLRAEVDRRIETEGYDVQRLEDATIIAKIITNHLDVIVLALGFVALAMMGVSALGMASSLGVSVKERSREIGVLRAMGARKWTLRAMLSGEAIVMALLAWGLSTLVSLPTGRLVAGALGTSVIEYPLDYRTSWGGMALSLGIAMVMAILASLAASRHATKQPIREALSYE